MADFESTANAAVTSLQEVQTLNGTIGIAYVREIPKLDNMANEYRELTTSLTTGLASLNQKVQAASNGSRAKVSELREKLGELSMRATELRGAAKATIEERENKIKSYDSQIEEKVDDAKELTDQLVFDIDGTRDAIDESNEALAGVFTKTEQRIEESAKGLQELEATLENEVETFGQFVEQRGTAQLKQSMTDVSDKLMDNFDVWKEAVHKHDDLMQSMLRQTPENVNEYQDDGWQKVELHIGTMAETYSIDELNDLSAKYSKALIDLNDQMKASEKIYQKFDEKAVDVAEVLRKAASR